MTQTPTSTTQSAREMADQFPEINPSNYDHDDVTALNNWGCEVVDVLRTVAAATVSRDREAIAWCQPTDCGKPTPRKFIVRFEDPDQGEAHFDNEAEAREFWKRSNTAWTCWLFATLPLNEESTPAAGYEAGEMREALDALRTHSGQVYCKYIEKMSEDKCLGVESKIASHTFSRDNLDAHNRAYELLGTHRGLATAIATIAAALAALPVQGTQSSEGADPTGDIRSGDCPPASAAMGLGAPSEAIPTREVEVLRKLAFGLSPAEQFRLAFLVAENVGYVLEREPSHPDCPHEREKEPSEAIPVGTRGPTLQDKIASTLDKGGYVSDLGPDAFDELVCALTVSLTPLVLGGDDFQTRRAQTELSGHDGSEAKSGESSGPARCPSCGSGLKSYNPETNDEYEGWEFDCYAIITRQKSGRLVVEANCDDALENAVRKLNAARASPTDGDVAS